MATLGPRLQGHSALTSALAVLVERRRRGPVCKGRFSQKRTQSGALKRLRHGGVSGKTVTDVVLG